MNYSTPLQRLIAALIDRFLVILFVILSIFFLTLQLDTDSLIRNAILMVIFWLLIFPADCILEAFLTAKYGGSLGKLFTGLEVQRATGGRISFNRAILRNCVGSFVSSAFLCLGYIWIFIDKKRQAWHDMIADTYVVTVFPRGIIIGVAVLLSLIVLSFYTGVESIKNIVGNSNFYNSIISEVKESLPLQDSKVIGDYTFPTATPAPKQKVIDQGPFIDPNIMLIETDAQAITASNFAKGFFTNNQNEWGLINYENVPVNVTITFKTPVVIKSITSTFSSCTDPQCYFWSAWANSKDLLFISDYTTPNKLTSQQNIAYDTPITSLKLIVGRVGGPDSFVHWKKIKLQYQ